MLGFASKEKRVQKRMKRFSSRIRALKDPDHKYASVMKEFKTGKLYSSSGHVVKNPAQARAIAMSMSGKKSDSYKAKSKNQQSKKKTFLSRLKGLLSWRRS